jgi:hypothetical protein
LIIDVNHILTSSCLSSYLNPNNQKKNSHLFSMHIFSGLCQTHDRISVAASSCGRRPGNRGALGITLSLRAFIGFLIWAILPISAIVFILII